jgi:putative YhdH/YhfP family quinone oxidoreductase
MSVRKFRALVVEETGENRFEGSIKDRSTDDLPEGEVLIRVHYSSLNYKDALSATGNKGVTKNYPHTPGIDASGADKLCRWYARENVLVTSLRSGRQYFRRLWGYIRVPAGWVKLPEAFIEDNMIYSTAFTAALSVTKWRSTGSIRVWEGSRAGATGGVGSSFGISRSGLRRRHFRRKTDQKQLLLDLGVKEVISREDATDKSGRALLKARWAGAVDTVGGDILATAIKSTKQHGVVTCCGNVASADLPINVYPFILRGVSLVGIDSAYCPMDIRKKVWAKIAGEWKIDRLDVITTEITLAELDKNIELILRGGQKGRVVINMMK